MRNHSIGSSFVTFPHKQVHVTVPVIVSGVIVFVALTNDVSGCPDRSQRAAFSSGVEGIINSIQRKNERVAVDEWEALPKRRSSRMMR